MHPDPEYLLKRVKIYEVEFPSFNENKLAWLNELIEVVYLGKNSYAGYKNNVKGNLRIFAALQVTTITALIVLIPTFYFLKDGISAMDPKDFVTLIITLIGSYCAAVGGIFLKEKNSLYEKWKYLADLYNEILKIDPETKVNRYEKRNLLKVALAMDILAMEMWSHESYCNLFHSCLKDAIRSHAPKLSAEYMIDHLESAPITKNEVKAYLETYQQRLLYGNDSKSA